jgi:hypothetical protein
MPGENKIAGQNRQAKFSFHRRNQIHGPQIGAAEENAVKPAVCEQLTGRALNRCARNTDDL